MTAVEYKYETEVHKTFNSVFKLKSLANRTPHGANCARATRD